jgi:hypothetical protein
LIAAISNGNARLIIGTNATHAYTRTITNVTRVTLISFANTTTYYDNWFTGTSNIKRGCLDAVITGTICIVATARAIDNMSAISSGRITIINRARIVVITNILVLATISKDTACINSTCIIVIAINWS